MVVLSVSDRFPGKLLLFRLHRGGKADREPTDLTELLKNLD